MLKQLNSTNQDSVSQHSKKKWKQYSRQHRAFRKKQMSIELKTALSLCKTSPSTVHMTNKEGNETIVLDIETGKFTTPIPAEDKENSTFSCSVHQR